MRQLDFREDRIEIRQHVFNMVVPVEVDGSCLQQFIQTVCNVSEGRCRQIHLSSPEAVFIGQKEEVDTYVALLNCVWRVFSGMAFIRNHLAYKVPNR